jgi:hypothetical protein
MEPGEDNAKPQLSRVPPLPLLTSLPIPSSPIPTLSSPPITFAPPPSRQTIHPLCTITDASASEECGEFGNPYHRARRQDSDERHASGHDLAVSLLFLTNSLPTLPPLSQSTRAYEMTRSNHSSARRRALGDLPGGRSLSKSTSQELSTPVSAARQGSPPARVPSPAAVAMLSTPVRATPMRVARTHTAVKVR